MIGSGQELPAALDSTYLGFLRTVVRNADENKLYVVFDMHSFLKYWYRKTATQGDQKCLDSDEKKDDYRKLLARTWRILAFEFRNERAVLGYDLMNEPTRMEDGQPCSSKDWDYIAQSVINAIREVDQNHLIFVEGRNYSLASHWKVDNTGVTFVKDRITPPRIVYSPHVYFDFANDSQFTDSREGSGPVARWEYYVRDRLTPVIDWSKKHNVPVLFGETNVPCTSGWASVLEHSLTRFFDPERLSVIAWRYIDPARNVCTGSSCPPSLNLVDSQCSDRRQLNVFGAHPPGPYSQTEPFNPSVADSLIFDGGRINPWDSGTGFFGTASPPQCVTAPQLAGKCAWSFTLARDNFSALKFIHHFGIDSRRYGKLTFRIYAPASVNFKIFTTTPRTFGTADDHIGADAVFPVKFEQYPELAQYRPSATEGWQKVEIPISHIVDPCRPLLNGIAFQNTGLGEGTFYLDEVRLEPASSFSTALPSSCRTIGVDYGPFRDGQSPGAIYPTADQLCDDALILKKIAGVVRTYSVLNGFDKIISCGKSEGLKVAPGAWIGSNQTANNNEVDALIAALGQHDNIPFAIVGSESILRFQSGQSDGLSKQALLQHIARVKAVTVLPVTTAEPWHIWLANPDLVTAVDFIFVNIFPYWEGQSIDNATTFLLNKYRDLKTAYPNKRIVISETGWPSDNGTNSAVMALEQQRFLREFLEMARAENIEFFLFSAFDEKWKLNEPCYAID